MKIHIKAALLSALVFPGIGQLYKGDRVKGIIILVGVNILLLVLFCLVLQQLMPLILSAQEGGVTDTTKILERLHLGGPVVRLLLAAFGGLWFYGWIDAAVGKKRQE
jgi:TM2 domain-containing membrane protein YozV